MWHTTKRLNFYWFLGSVTHHPSNSELMVPSSPESPQWPTWEFLYSQWRLLGNPHWHRMLQSQMADWTAAEALSCWKSILQSSSLFLIIALPSETPIMLFMSTSWNQFKNLQLGLSLENGMTNYDSLLSHLNWPELSTRRGRNCCCVTTFWEVTRYFHHFFSPPNHFHTSDVITLFPCTTQLAILLLTYPPFFS